MTAGLGERRKPARVVCIQDGDDRDGIMEGLQAEAHLRARSASSTAEALRRHGDEPIDLVVLDITDARAPVADQIRHLRNHRASAAAGILAITDAEQRPRALTGLERGADAYLVRPVETRRLVAQVDALLRIRWAERQARRLARDWRVAFDAITDGILVLSRQCEIMRCNRAALRILGATRDEVIGRDYREVWQDPERVLPADLPALGTSTGPFSTEIAFERRWYRLAVDPIADDGGRSSGDVVVVLTDITELKRYQHELRVQAEQLQQHNRRQTEFLGLLAHELRNPLGAISAAAEVIDETRGAAPGAADDAQAAEALAIIGRQVGNLSRMVSDILDVSRIAEGKIALQRESFDLRESVRAAVAAARPSAQAMGHTLTSQLDDAPLTVDADATRIEQMLANLIDNAIKYTPRGGHIEVFAGPDPRDARLIHLRVRDDGLGMPPERANEAFDMFVQYERTLDRAQGGLGLGLTLVKRLAELHGGSVAAYSEGVGRGATFEVRVPRASAAGEPRAHGARVESVPIARAAARRSVLVVEDNDDLRQLLAWKFRRAGHRVTEARTGPEGLERACSSVPDAVVLDVGLPELDGYALARALRARDETRRCQLIALTGYGSARDREAAARAGIDVHLVKPVNFEELLALIERGSDRLS